MILAQLTIQLPGPWLGSEEKRSLSGLDDAGCLIHPLRDLRVRVDDKEAEGLDQLRSLLKDYRALDDGPDDGETRKERRRLVDRLYNAYWASLDDLLQFRLRLSLTDPFEPSLEELAFIDFGVVDDTFTACPVGMVAEFYSEDHPVDGFRYGRFSDYLAEEWVLSGKGPFPAPKGGLGLEEQMEAIKGEIKAKRRQRRFLLNLVARAGGERSVEALSEKLTFLEEHLLDRLEIRLRTYRVRFAEAPEEVRLDAIRSQWDEARGAWLAALDRWEGTSIDDLVKLVRSLREVDADEEKAARLLVHLSEERRRRAARRDRLHGKDAFRDDTARRLFLGDAVRRKREFLGMAAKRAKVERSAFFRGARGMVRWGEISAALTFLTAHDPGLMETLRVRIHGLPRVVTYPAMGNAVYDWEDHSWLVPLYPPKGVETSLAWGMALFRWDADEDRELKDGYGLLKANKGKSIAALQESFCEDYQVWMTREVKGYRVLPGEVFRWFSQHFRSGEEKG